MPSEHSWGLSARARDSGKNSARRCRIDGLSERLRCDESSCAVTSRSRRHDWFPHMED